MAGGPETEERFCMQGALKEGQGQQGQRTELNTVGERHALSWMGKDGEEGASKKDKNQWRRTENSK